MFPIRRFSGIILKPWVDPELFSVSRPRWPKAAAKFLLTVTNYFIHLRFLTLFQWTYHHLEPGKALHALNALCCRASETLVFMPAPGGLESQILGVNPPNTTRMNLHQRENPSWMPSKTMGYRWYSLIPTFDAFPRTSTLTISPLTTRPQLTWFQLEYSESWQQPSVSLFQSPPLITS